VDKQTFLNAVQTERAELDSLLAQVDKARLTRPGAEGEWSVKDIIAHIAWHEREMIGLLQARTLAGSDLWNLPLHERNAAIFQLNQARALDDVLAEARQAFQQFWEAVQTLSDEELADPRKFRDMPDDWRPWKIIAENSFEHYHDHLPDLRAWLDETKTK
jgi:uncharacterized damage-inducible protein DinB